jgi:hypothetical protein
MINDKRLEKDPKQAYAEFRKAMMAKYEANIKSLNKYYHGMETFICMDVLCANARAYARGDMKEIWPGAGAVDMLKLVADVKMLDDLAVYEI